MRGHTLDANLKWLAEVHVRMLTHSYTHSHMLWHGQGDWQITFKHRHKNPPLELHVSLLFHICGGAYWHLCACVFFPFNGWVWVIQRHSSPQFCPVESLLLGWWNVEWCHVAELFISSEETGECNQTVLIESCDVYSSSHIRAHDEEILVLGFIGCVEIIPRREEALNNQKLWLLGWLCAYVCIVFIYLWVCVCWNMTQFSSGRQIFLCRLLFMVYFFYVNIN